MRSETNEQDEKSERLDGYNTRIKKKRRTCSFIDRIDRKKLFKIFSIEIF